MEYSFVFGHLVKARRMLQSKIIRDVSEQTGVDRATISRVENGLTQPTLNTAVHLGERLNISPGDYLQALHENGWSSSSDQGEVDSLGAAVLTLDDVRAFLARFHQDAPRGRAILAALLSYIVGHFEGEKGNAKEREWVFPAFHPDDVDKFLFRSQVYSLDIHYPQISSRLLRGICQQGGAMIPSDIWCLIQDTPQERLDEA